MGAAAPNSGFHPLDGPNGTRSWRMFIGEAGSPDMHDGPTATGGDDVEITDSVMSVLIQAARMSYAIEDAPGTVESDVFAKAIEAFAPADMSTWYDAQTATWRDRIRDNTRLQPDPLKDPLQ